VNLTTMIFLPFLGLDGFSDRGPGSGGQEALAQVAAVLLTTAALLWQTEGSGSRSAQSQTPHQDPSQAK
jgi:hypothetical protein